MAQSPFNIAEVEQDPATSLWDADEATHTHKWDAGDAWDAGDDLEP